MMPQEPTKVSNLGRDTLCFLKFMTDSTLGTRTHTQLCSKHPFIIKIANTSSTQSNIISTETYIIVF